jgi:solute carrier family 13 (sodium-dependent dicarboxylate transporter), member 2/3/5
MGLTGQEDETDAPAGEARGAAPGGETPPSPERPDAPSRGLQRRIGLVLGPALLLATLVLPEPGGMAPDAWRVAGLGLLMATWWVTEAIPIPVTALLPLPLLPLLGVSPIEDAAAPFANPIIFLFMGGFMIAQAMQRWNLHRRLAFAIITRTGTGPVHLVAGFMLAAAFLSMWVSNTAVAVMMLPIGLSVIEVLENGETDAGGREASGQAAFAVALLLGIAYGSSIGGVATLIGTPPNALLAGFLADEYGIRIDFARWMLVGLPLTLVLLPLTWFLLTRVIFRVDPAGPPLPATLLGELRERMGGISVPERRVAWVFAGTAVAWISRPLVERWVPGLSDAGIAMAATVLLFLIPARAGEPGGSPGSPGEGGAGAGEKGRRPRSPGEGHDGALLNWAWARRIPWGILLLFGGGLSLATAITRSGLAAWIGESLGGAAVLPLFALLLVVAAVVVFLTELTSNTATAAAFVPILAGLAVALGRDPLLLTVVAALSASCAFMLPVATPPNAIIFGSGRVRMDQMVRAGFLLNLLVIVLAPLVAGFALRLFFGVGW